MARLPYVEADQSPAAGELYGQIERMGRPVLNLYRELANQPPALAAFLEMSRYVRSESSLDPGLRELAILATAHALGQEYEVLHHTEAARRAGVPANKIAATAPGGSLESMTAAERCAVEFSRQAARTGSPYRSWTRRQPRMSPAIARGRRRRITSRGSARRNSGGRYWRTRS